MKNSCDNCCNDKKLAELIALIENKELTPIQVLQEIQDAYGYLPQDIVEKCANVSGVPMSEFYSIMTFYSQFKLQPKAKYDIEICIGTACYVKGADRILDLIVRHLKTKEHVTDESGKFCYHCSRCFGCCSLAPVVKINGKIFPKMTTTKMEKILKECDVDEF